MKARSYVSVRLSNSLLYQCKNLCLGFTISSLSLNRNSKGHQFCSFIENDVGIK